MTGFKRRATGLLAATAAVAALAAGGAARADEDSGNRLAWSTASATVGVCQVGVTCGQPNGVAIVARRQSTDTDVVSTFVAVGPPAYLAVTNGGFFGNARASAEAGEGLLSLPELHAFAESRSVGFGPNPYIGVDIAMVQAVQGYTNTSGGDLVIPLNAFQGVVDFGVTLAPGTISAGIAITTDAILNPDVAGLWSAQGGAGHFGEFTAGCGTTGALAFGQSGATNVNPLPTTQFLNVAATSCGGDTFTLAQDQTFYVWARLAVLHTASGVTDAEHTFNVSIAPQYQAQVQTALAPGLTFASGENLDIPVAAIPEPGAWALMIAGFGGVGAVLRRRKSLAATA